MRKILTLLFVLLSFGLYAQIQMRTALRAQVYAASGSNSIFSVQIITGDDLSRFDATYVTPGDLLYVIDGSFCYELEIISIQFQSGSLLQCTVRDNDNVLTTVPLGQGAILSPYPNYNLTYFIASLREDLQSCLFHRTAQIIDNIVDTRIDSVSNSNGFLKFYVYNVTTNVVIDSFIIPILNISPIQAVAANNGTTAIINNDTLFISTNGNLLALNNLNTTGIVTRLPQVSGNDVITTRQLQAGDGIDITNGDGISGNPTISIIGIVAKNMDDAATLGVQIGQFFIASSDNSMGAIPGSLIKRVY
jgi:hypothetical protein